MSMPIPQHGMPNAQLMAAQRNMPQPNDSALRRSRKPTDKNIPDGVEDVIIGDGVQQYKRLRELERQLDATMVRKRLDIQDSITRTVRRYRTLRIWISNTVENQPWQKVLERNGTLSRTNPGSGRYKVRIEGQLLDDDNDPMVPDDSDDEDGDAPVVQEGLEATGLKRASSKQPLSHFFKSITIDFDKTPVAKPEDVAPITWNKHQSLQSTIPGPPSADFDCLQFSRASQENLNMTVSLVRDENPERYKLSKELAEVLDVEEESRTGIVLGIWDYIRAAGLQEDEEKRQVRCDARLRSVWETLPLSSPAVSLCESQALD